MNSQITTKEFAAKLRTKHEIYTFLTVEVQAYLPKEENITTYFMKDLLSGSKKCKYATKYFYFYFIVITCN